MNAHAFAVIPPLDHEPAPWTFADAAHLIRIIEDVAPKYGCHVGLTGGVLYKDGPRKDLDLVFYRIRQSERIEVDGLLMALVGLGINIRYRLGWMAKAHYGERNVDLLFPDSDIGGFPEHYQ